MIRHPALRPLSRDHHFGLLDARSLRSGEPGALEQLRASWRELLAGHLETEERLLLPLLDHLPAGRDAAARLRREHAGLRLAWRALCEASEPSQTALAELGRLLHDHIRWEERVLFPLLEQRLDAQQLARLGEQLEPLDARRQACSPLTLHAAPPRAPDPEDQSP